MPRSEMIRWAWEEPYGQGALQAPLRILLLAGNCWSLRLKLEKKVKNKMLRWAKRPIYSLPEGWKYRARKREGMSAGTAIVWVPTHPASSMTIKTPTALQEHGALTLWMCSHTCHQHSNSGYSLVTAWHCQPFARILPRTPSPIQLMVPKRL